MNPETISRSRAVELFNNGRGNLFYQLQAGEPAILVNLHSSFGFCYLGKLNRPPKFRGVTASQAVENALKAGRNVIFTDNKPHIETP